MPNPSTFEAPPFESPTMAATAFVSDGETESMSRSASYTILLEEEATYKREPSGTRAMPRISFIYCDEARMVETVPALISTFRMTSFVPTYSSSSSAVRARDQGA